MESIRRLKVVFTTIVSGIMSLLGVLAIPFLLLVGCNVIDYVTGIIASKYRNEKISSYKGIKGIYKKICMWLLVLIGSWMDSLVNYSIQYAGFEFQEPFIFAIVVCIWLVANEIISILENMLDADVDIPPFLLPLAQRIKTAAESKTAKEVTVGE